MSIEIRGTDVLENALKEVATLNDVKLAIKNNASDMQRKAQRKAPVDTGNLKRSIKLDIRDGGYVGVVRSDAEYSGYLEYGTRFMSAQPFMRPSLEEVKPIFAKDIARLMK